VSPLSRENERRKRRVEPDNAGAAVFRRRQSPRIARIPALAARCILHGVKFEDALRALLHAPPPKTKKKDK